MAARIALARDIPRPVKRRSGKTDISRTPLVIRSRISLSPETKERIRTGVSRKLRKFASRIERVIVRFDDLNGPRGGVDTECHVKVVLAGAATVVVTERAATPEVAFGRASHSAERAVRRTLQRLGLSSPRRSLPQSEHEPTRSTTAAALTSKADPGSRIGRRVGRAASNLEQALDRPEKRRRDVPVDTSASGKSASDRRVGGRSTAARNAKRNQAGMTATLEDSQTRPSRKSTRRSSNRAKSGTNLARRKSRAMHTAKVRAQRKAK